ncbi:MAG: M20 family metallopeptidase [Bacillota bacterium]|nr:M20 family metallopeptidase [Bacillota bacterium]
MENVLSRASKLSDQIISWRRELHKIPEVGLLLPKTAGYVTEVLKGLGIPYVTYPSYSGLAAIIEGKKAKPQCKTVALRADMDALPIKELTDVPFKSDNGNMHACGHDAHTAMLLGAAKLLSEMKDELTGNVKLIFEPGEETTGGALPMIEDGVLDNPKVGLILGQHAGYLAPGLPKGHFGFYPGDFMASCDSFVITVRGKGCHGAAPAEGVDPVVISAAIITALQTLVSREINGTDSAVLTIGAIHGGEVYNIIPETVEMRGAFRCLSEEMRAYFEKRVNEICKGISETMRASCTFDFEPGFPVTTNDPTVTEFVMKIAERMFGENRIHLIKKPLMGSEDMSYFLNKCPGCYWVLSNLADGSEMYSNHSPYFKLDESCLHTGTALMVEAAVEWLNRSENRG